MMCIIELLYIEVTILYFNDCTFIVIYITVIGSRKYCNYWGEM